MKLVVFNGRLLSSHGCTAPTDLVVGKTYAVKSVEYMDNYTVYTLQSIPGRFNSACFDEIDSLPTYYAFAMTAPVVGEHYSIKKINNHNQIEAKKTSTIRYVELIADKTFKVITQNSIYIVQI